METKGLPIRIIGVTFESLQKALCYLYFGHETMEPEEFEACLKYIVPMQHNFMQPIMPDADDTFIQYWIDELDRLTHDYLDGNFDSCKKVASVTLRFIGKRAEQWAAVFHHLTKRETCNKIFSVYCNAGIMPYVSPIRPTNVDYFGVGNTVKAFTLNFKLEFDELLDLSNSESGGDRLMYISLAPGTIEEGG